MSGVVLRCPNCGTTRGTPGECEACHEAQVRYYCTNHSPGRWLERPVCSQCGAVFGEKAQPRAPSPAPAARSRAPPTARPPAPTARPRPVYPPAARPGAEGSSTGGPPKRDDDVIPDGEHYGRTPSLHELLLEALRARHMPPPEPPYERETPAPRAGPGIGGCLVRMMLLLFFLFLAMMSGVFLFATSWL
jgi:hypothetical protein